jgi:hypothetical protein
VSPYTELCIDCRRDDAGDDVLVGTKLVAELFLGPSKIESSSPYIDCLRWAKFVNDSRGCMVEEMNDGGREYAGGGAEYRSSLRTRLETESRGFVMSSFGQEYNECLRTGSGLQYDTCVCSDWIGSAFLLLK